MIKLSFDKDLEELLSVVVADEISKLEAEAGNTTDQKVLTSAQLNTQKNTQRGKIVSSLTLK